MPHRPLSHLQRVAYVLHLVWPHPAPTSSLVSILKSAFRNHHSLRGSAIAFRPRTSGIQGRKEMASPGIIDPTKVGRYPVVLSDALLGKKSKEVYTGVKYNHKPDQPPAQAKLRQNTSSKSAFDLTYQDGGMYKYRGNRSSDDGQYVLVFDPSREVFVLHKVDSTFNMNLISTPTNKDAESLRKEYPHLKNSSTEDQPVRKAATKSAGRDNAARKKDEPLKANNKKQQQQQQPPPPPQKKRDPQSEEEDSSDDDAGLVMEFPGGEAPGSNRDFSPAFPPRRFSEFVSNVDEEEDADGEDDDDSSDEHFAFKLPSPINYSTSAGTTSLQQPQPVEVHQTMQEEAEEESEEDEEQFIQVQPEEEQADEMDVDLEAELEAELEANMSESDVSEED
ncbi:RNA polymerase II transcription elongation factor-domain-containing protein [Xylariales sp. PMI_506]|nr:RNA polymerase II transcription elongation factor-domain-containing protein [Xylariales sp. PMI_506]